MLCTFLCQLTALYVLAEFHCHQVFESCLRVLWSVSHSLLMFAFEGIVFIKVLNLFTPIGADLNQRFLEPSVFVWFISK